MNYRHSELLFSGSLVLPINELQCNGTDFIFPSYGLVTRWLCAGIPVRKILKVNNTPSQLFNFSAKARRITSGLTATASVDFGVGAFFVPADYAMAALAADPCENMSSFTHFANSNNVRVYELTEDTAVDVQFARYLRPIYSTSNITTADHKKYWDGVLFNRGD